MRGFQYITIFILMVSSFLSLAQTKSVKSAQQIESTKQKLPISVEAKSDRYDFIGRRFARTDAYGFDRILIQSQTLKTSVKSGLWTHGVEMSYLDNYSELKAFGKVFENRTNGFGDLSLSTQHLTVVTKKWTLVTRAGITIPTGSIDERNPRNPKKRHAYYLQLGSGTWDIRPTVIGFYNLSDFQIGGLGLGILRTGRNSVNYRLGDRYYLSTWVEYKAIPKLKPSLQLNFKHVDKINGLDETIGRNIFTEYYHSVQQTLDLSFALTGRWNLGFLPGSYISYKGSLPLVQNSNNIVNLKVDKKYTASASFNYTY